MNKTYIITDTHLHHKNIMKFENRPENFDEIIISNWNKVVGKDDLVIHLGDVIIGRQSELAGIMASLNGRKWLIKGNHDREKNSWYLKRGFESVSEHPIYVQNIIFSHYPVTEEFPPFADINVHGHLHRSSVHSAEVNPDQEYYDGRYYLDHKERYFNLSAWFEDNLAPIYIEDLKKLISNEKNT